MLKFSQFLITLPVLALPFSALAVKPALAEATGIERALELLAKAVVVDNKCNVLTVQQRDELSTYVAKAEIAAAEKTSLAVTRAALASGRKQGQSAACNSPASVEVKETLNAARQAISAAEQEENAAPEPVLATQAPVPFDGLSVYGRIIETYYLERRCTYLSRRKMKAFYRAVVKGHAAAVSEHGKTAVFKIMRAAEARANYQNCNASGEARVRAGFAEIASR